MKDHDAMRWAALADAAIKDRDPACDTLLVQQVYAAVASSRDVGVKPERVLLGALLEALRDGEQRGREAAANEARIHALSLMKSLELSIAKELERATAHWRKP